MRKITLLCLQINITVRIYTNQNVNWANRLPYDGSCVLLTITLYNNTLEIKYSLHYRTSCSVSKFNIRFNVSMM